MAYITIKNATGTSLHIEDAIEQKIDSSSTVESVENPTTLLDQLNNLANGTLYNGVNNITQTNNNLPFILDLDYYTDNNSYCDLIYSQDDRNDLKIWFNDVELENAPIKCEMITRKSRILPDDGSKRFSLDNFISTSLEVILHNVDLENIVDQVKISIGTLIDSTNNTYQYIPLGVFNIQDTPTNDNGKITLKLRDNRVKFDFGYNAQPLIEESGGSVTKMQILEDICEQAGVTNTITSFYGDSDLVGIYDNTIMGSTYVAYLMEQAGLIPVIDRLGRLSKVDLSNLYTWRIPLSILETGFEIGEPYKIDRVVYESGIIKYETSDDETLDTLYLDSANPYISSQSQVNYIYNKLKDFEIDSVITKKVLGNPAIDPYDLIQVYNDLDGTNDVVFTTLANTTYTYNGKHRDTFDTQIGKEQRTENVSLKGEEAFKKYAKTEIDNINAQINLITSETMIFSNNLVGVGSVTLENAYEGTLHRLEITGNIQPLYPSNSLYPSESLLPLDTYLIVDDETTYYLDIDYLNFTSADEHDTYVYEEGKQWIERADGTIEESDKEILIQVSNDSTIEFHNFTNSVLKVKYLLQNDYTNTFTNQMDIVSQINLSPSEIGIQAHKIKLEGYTTINNGFGVDLDGNMFANNGTFQGNIYLADGNKVIGGDGLFSCLSYTSTGRYSNWDVLGFGVSGVDLSNTATRYQDVFVNAYIPENFVITSAYAILQVTSVNTAYSDINGSHDTIGKPKDLALMVGVDNTSIQFFYYPYQAVDEGIEYGGNEITNAFTNGKYTPNISSPGDVIVVKSIDIKEYLTIGEMNTIFVRSLLSPKPEVHTFTPSGASYTAYNYKDIVENTGVGRLNLFVFGYMNMEEI